MLEAESQQTPMLLPQGIKIAKGESFKAEKRVIHLIKASPDDLYVNEEGYTMKWLRKWHHFDLQEKLHLRKDQ